MKTIINKQLTFLFILFSLTSFALFGQSNFNIDYYGIVTSDIDSNMSKMTSDLYYTQLCEINSFVVNDMRIETSMETAPKNDQLSSANLSFYAVISKKEDSTKWISTLTLVDKANNTKQAETKEYDSYYKILMEPKSVLQESLKNLIENKGIAQTESTPSFDLPEAKTQTIVSTEFLSGTWSGEANVDKIVIMRGGRGFVIFTNGASMNISIELKTSGNNENQIIITQNSRANASFYPELSRQVALKEAVSAAPIQWIFSLANDGTLTGVKNTLIEKDGSAIQASLDVTWKRKS